MITGKFVRAYWPWTWLLRLTGMYGITMPWGSIYVRESAWDWEELRFHELVHIAQINRDGPVRFSIRYLWELITKGYRNISYEQEAYEMGFGGDKSPAKNRGARGDEEPTQPTGQATRVAARSRDDATDDTGTGSLINTADDSETDGTKRRKLGGTKPSMIG